MNLPSNALKFTPEGGRINVGGRLDGEVAEVSVADTGVGIAPADQEAVFEEFRQVGAAEKRAEGTCTGALSVGRLPAGLLAVLAVEEPERPVHCINRPSRG